MDAPDVVVVGAGADGLSCAITLARTGLTVAVVEERPIVGGVFRTEYPFARAPRLAAQTGSHRAGFFPAALARALGVDPGLGPREPALFAPTATPGRFLLAGAGNEGLRAAAGGALDAMHAELDAMLEDLGAAWLGAAQQPVDDVADRYVRPELREAFVALCRGSLSAYAARFGLGGGLALAAVAADALVGSWAAPDSPGSGAPLLFAHAARASTPSIGAAGVIRLLESAARAARVSIVTGASVREIALEGNAAAGVVLDDGREIRGTTIVASADPQRLAALVGLGRLSGPFGARVQGLARPGGVAKVNLALSALPRFSAVPEDRGQHRAAALLLPGDDAVAVLARAFAEASAGAFPAAPPLECVFASSPGEPLHHASIMIPWAPYDLAGTTWAAEEERAREVVLSVLEWFAPGTRASIVDAHVLHPKKLETHFGVTRGQLQHADGTVVFGDRLPHVTPIAGLYSCSAACAPGPGMLGVAGHTAACRVLADFELGLERTAVEAPR